MMRDSIDFTLDELNLIRSKAAQINLYAVNLRSEKFQSQAFGRAITNYFRWVREDTENIVQWATSASSNKRESISLEEYQTLALFKRRLKGDCNINNLMHAYSLLPADISAQDRKKFNGYVHDFDTNLFPLPLED